MLITKYESHGLSRLVWPNESRLTKNINKKVLHLIILAEINMEMSEGFVE